MAEITRIFDLLQAYENEYYEKPDALAGKNRGNWIYYTGKDYVDIVNGLCSAFLNMGIQKGDTIATVLKNCPQWNFIDMALQSIGAVHVPIYPTISADNFRYIFLDAKVSYIFVSNTELYHRIESALKDIPSLMEVFSVDHVKGLRTVKELIDEGYQHSRNGEINKIRESILPDDLTTLIYTSGTTGQPKGVMLSHRNIVSNFLALNDILPQNIVVRGISFLPLCHVYERVINYLYHIRGISIYYSETIESLSLNLKEVHPEMFCAVPRVIEKFFDKIVAKGRTLPWMKRQFFFWAVNQGYHYELYGRNTLWFKLQHRIAKQLVYKKWREALGGRLQIIVSVGAALQPRLAHVFWAAGIMVMEGYGLTETSPVIAVSNFDFDGVKIGTVGPPLPGTEIKIAGDGEILCKGPNVMLGYYRQPEATKEVIDEEGFLHTGDIGILEPGTRWPYLRITDRKKEIFKTSGGKWIAPQTLENKFKESPFIENIMVLGDNQPYPVALIVPSFEHLRNWARIKGIKITTNHEITSDKQVFRRIQREIACFNHRLDKTEQIKRFRLVYHDWTTDTGELSQTLKLKRRVIAEKYHRLIEEMYG